MPAPGTKKIIINGAEVYVSADEAALEEALAAGAAAQQAFDVAKAMLDEAKARIVPLAEARRDGKGTVHLRSFSGAACVVTWARETKLDDAQVVKLEAELPAEEFAQAFECARSFKLRKTFQALMKLQQQPAVERLKARIAACITVRNKLPTVKFAEGDDTTEG